MGPVSVVHRAHFYFLPLKSTFRIHILEKRSL